MFTYFHVFSWALMDSHGFSWVFNIFQWHCFAKKTPWLNIWKLGIILLPWAHGDRGKNATGRIWHLKDDQIESKSNVVQVSQELIPNHNQTSGKLEHFSVAANHPTWSGDWFSSPASAHLIPWKQLTMSVSVGKTSEKIVLVNNFM